MRARLAIYFSGIQVELREVDLKNKPAELVHASPKATTPTLVLANGEVVDESLDIMQWALEQNDSTQLLAYNPTLDALIEQNDGRFKYALDRYKYITRYPGEEDVNWRAEGEVFLEKLESILADKPYLNGAKATLPDLAIFPFVRQFRMPNKEWFDTTPRYPHMRRWLNKWLEGASFKAIMKKHAVWAPQNTPYFWPEQK